MKPFLLAMHDWHTCPSHSKERLSYLVRMCVLHSANA